MSDNPRMNFPNSVAELLQALVRIPSVNPHGNPGVERPGEQACGEFVAEFLRDCGARVELREVKPGRPNVVGIFPSDRPGKPRLVFAPHLDTVSVEGMTIDPFGGELREGKIYGRGASDTKGPMAAMLWALRESRELIPSLPFEIWFAGLMGEEAGQTGAKAFVAEHRVDFAVIGEPTDLQIVHTTKGSTWLTLTTRGKAVHSASPERGENAIYKMADVLRVMRDEIAADLEKLTAPKLGSPTISAGTIRGGSKTNIVPDLCRCEVDIRTIPGQDTAPILEKLRAACPGIEIETWESKPMFTDPSHPLIAALEKSGGACVGAPWFCDAAIFSEAGIPAVACGPGSIAQAHTEDEFIRVDDLERGVGFFGAFLAEVK